MAPEGQAVLKVSNIHLHKRFRLNLKEIVIFNQRNRHFRWKERFFILTKDYFHCFKKDSSKLTEMGEFLFKVYLKWIFKTFSKKANFQVKLVDIDGVSLLDKRGYLTICISQLRDGRLYLRKHEGIRDWFNTIQVRRIQTVSLVPKKLWKMLF